MFGFSQKKKGSVIEFHVKGMHCSSCSMNIDGALEDTDGVLESSTSYAKGITKVTYDPKRIQPKQLQKVIEHLDYCVINA